MAYRNPFDPALFGPDAVAPETTAFNKDLGSRLAAIAKARAEGVDPGGLPPVFPVVPKSPRAEVRSISAPDGRQVELRVLAPENPRGAYLHLHGGGLIMGSADQNDVMLARIADATGLVSVSVEYRLAPQHPYPAAWDDCEAAALWLAKNLKAEFGGTGLAIGGESAGATLAVPTLVRMRDKHGFTGFQAANLSYGNYDTTMTPSQRLIGARGILLRPEDIARCSDMYAPEVSSRDNPDLSALYADVRNMPAALFSVGTLDAFLDDSLFVYARWIAAGNAAELAVYPGAIHGFNSFPIPVADEANARIDAFLKANTKG